jgi:Fic family protein
MTNEHWERIKDLPEEFENQSDPDLRLLETEWQNVRLDTSEDKLNKILNEVKREWVIETGKIEGLYTLTKGITETLIKHGISAKLIAHSSTNLDPELVAAMLHDQQDVIEGLFDFVAQRRQLSLSYIREMHQTFTRHQETTSGLRPDGKLVEIPLIKGDWKKWPNNPLTPEQTVHEYCPPEHVPAEMDRLIEMHKEQAKKSISPEVEASFLHHRFTQIHPFQDGNGRVARALASLVFLRHGDFPFVVRDEERAAYIHALEEADRGQLTSLITFMSEKQKDLLYKALSEAQNLDIEQTINRIKERASQFYKVLNLNRSLFEQANQIIHIWRDSAEELLKKYLEAFKIKGEDGVTAPNYFEFITYDSIHSSLDLTGSSQIIGAADKFTIAIKFPSEKFEELRLYLCSIGKNDLPEALYGALYPIFGDKISSIKTDLALDHRIANLRFKDWLSEQLNQVFYQ